MCFFLFASSTSVLLKVEACPDRRLRLIEETLNRKSTIGKDPFNLCPIKYPNIYITVSIAETKLIPKGSKLQSKLLQPVSAATHTSKERAISTDLICQKIVTS
jgi:hypothetical protein